MKQYLSRKECILGHAKDGKSYQEIEATVDSLFPEVGQTTEPKVKK